MTLTVQPHSSSINNFLDQVDQAKPLSNGTTEHECRNNSAEILDDPMAPLILSNAASSDDLENLDDFKDAIDETIVTFFSDMSVKYVKFILLIYILFFSF